VLAVFGGVLCAVLVGKELHIDDFKVLRVLVRRGVRAGGAERADRDEVGIANEIKRRPKKNEEREERKILSLFFQLPPLSADPPLGPFSICEKRNSFFLFIKV
jgi:hypothetical protein